MQKTVEVTYQPEAMELIGSLLPYIKQAVAQGVTAAQQIGASLDKVKVTRFDSYEDPRYHEVIFTFYSSADRTKRRALMDRVSEAIGVWSLAQPDAIREVFQLASEVKHSNASNV